MKFPKLIHNRLSYLGLAVAGLAFVVFIFLFIVQTVLGTGRAPYAGLIVFVLVPTVLLAGLLVVPVGMGIEWIRWRREGERTLPVFPIVDLNDYRHRNAMMVFVAGTVLVVLLCSLSGYRAYQFTESVGFCGTLCHTVMKPEFTTYQHSPHARVDCVACHVGPGATWFVRSKISGIPQIFAVLTHTYDRPIPTPVRNLRPAQQTCEQCHWPEAFFGGQQKRLVHFLPDEHNTRWEINLLIRTGGGSPGTSRTEGIHWHMNIANRVEYIASDEKRQKITWVRMTDLRTGKSTEYNSGKPLSRQEIDRAGARRMDCMDCHNRPTHIFRSPSDAVNLAMATGALDASLPYLKRTAAALLSAPYETEEAGLQAIDRGIRQFYGEKYPGLAAQKPRVLSSTTAGVQAIFKENIFPYMKVRWDTHPDEIGHLVSLGCQRCHDGQHKSAEGVTITTKCDACHTILSQGSSAQPQVSTEARGLPFRHPVDIGEQWKETPCSECHTGAGA